MGADSARHPSSFSPWPHRLAVILACATFPLLFIGGLVTSLGVGLAVPDWPTTFGYNMFLYPWSKMIGGIFYEHSHRLVASCVGLLTIALALTLWLKEPRPWLRWLGVASARFGHLSRGTRRLACGVAATDLGDYSCLLCPGIFCFDREPGAVDLERMAQPTAVGADHGRRATAPVGDDHHSADLYSDHFWRFAKAYRRAARRPFVVCCVSGGACDLVAAPHHQAAWRGYRVNCARHFR